MNLSYSSQGKESDSLDALGRGGRGEILVRSAKTSWMAQPVSYAYDKHKPLLVPLPSQKQNMSVDYKVMFS